MSDSNLTRTLPWNWRQWTRTEMIKFLEPYGTPCRHSMRKSQLISVIEHLWTKEHAWIKDHDDE